MKVFLLLLFCPLFLLAQNPVVKPVFTDSNDSAIFSTQSSHSFDKYGHYSFEYEKNKNEIYLVTNEGTKGPFFSSQSSYSNSGSVNFYFKNKDEQKDFYYRNNAGTILYGPVSGHVEWQSAGSSNDMVGLSVSVKDSLFFYIDNRRVGMASKKTSNYQNWCTFSGDGHALYYVPKDSMYFLYFDDRLIDSSSESFYELHVVDGGYYTYATGQRPKTPDKYSYMFFIHTPDTVLGPVRTVWNHYLNNDSSYYYSGDDDGPEYIAVNNKLYKNINDVHDLLIRDQKHYLFTFTKQGKHKINVSGRIYTNDDDNDISLANMDTAGNFSFFKQKGYYLYKYVNGKQVARPVSRYGVRGVPLYISPKGSSVHYFQTDDSTYIYRDEQLLLRPVANRQKFLVIPWRDMIRSHTPITQPGSRNQLVYFRVGSTGYFLFNGTLSRPMLNVKRQTNGQSDTGMIIAGSMDEKGFYVIQKTGDKSFTVNINNTSYTTIEGIDKMNDDDCFFDGQELIFYARKGLSYYQYMIRL